MLSRVPYFIALFLFFVLHTYAHPIANDNDAVFTQASLNDGHGLLEVKGDNAPNDETLRLQQQQQHQQHESIPSYTNSAADNSPNFRVDEAQLAEYTIHSQAEDGGSSSSSGGFRISLLPTQEKTAESVNFEKEGIPSKIYSAYDKTQKKVVDLTNLEPIVDTISEHEKYGNNGDMFDGLARSIVNGYEAFSNLINTFIQKPKDLARSISKGITAQLDIIGGKIVGL